MGRIWKLTTSRGWADADTEVRFRDAAAGVGVHSPSNLPVVIGGYVLPLGSTQVLMYSWVDGTSLVGHRQIASWLGAILGRLHGLRMPPVREPDPWYDVVPSPAEWRALLSAAQYSGVSWYQQLAACLDRIAALAQACPCQHARHPDVLLPTLVDRGMPLRRAAGLYDGAADGPAFLASSQVVGGVDTGDAAAHCVQHSAKMWQRSGR
jgi:hypothetical protein